MTSVVFNQATGAAHAVVAAKANHSFKLMGAVLVAAGAVDVTIEDSAGTDLVGLCALHATGGQQLILPVTGVPYAQTASGKGLSVLLGGAVQVGGCVIYELVADAGQ